MRPLSRDIVAGTLHDGQKVHVTLGDTTNEEEPLNVRPI